MILRFSHILCNTVFPNRFERVDEDGNVELIRLVQGTNEVLVSKQDKNAKSKDFRTGYANVQEENEVFYQVEITDQSIINYLKKTPYWDKYIHEYDPIAVSEKASDEAKKDIAVLAQISAITDHTDLISLGYALFENEALDYAKAENYEGLRVQIFTAAMKDSEKVADLINNKDKSDYMLVALAFAKGILITGDAGNSILWGDQNGAKVLPVALGETPIDSLISFFATAEGREVRKLIGLKLEGKAKKTPAKTETTKVVKEDNKSSEEK